MLSMMLPANDRIRIPQIDGDTILSFLVNEGTVVFQGAIPLSELLSPAEEIP